MGEPALLDIPESPVIQSQPGLYLLPPVTAGETLLERFGKLFTPVTVLLLVLQVFDGLLTSAGVSTFGTMAEGNPLIRELMHHLGFVPAICVAKIAACLIIFLLAYKALQMKWIRPVLRVVAAVYIFGAIIPWTLILFGGGL